MQALNRAIGDADMFRKMIDKIEGKDAPAPRNISREVDEWNERVEREKFEKFEKEQIKRIKALERHQRDTEHP